MVPAFGGIRSPLAVSVAKMCLKSNEQPVGSGEAYLGYDGSYRSRFSSNPSASAYTWVDGYSLSNFRAGWRRDDLNIFAWVRNAFDQEYFELLSVQSGSTGLIVGQPGDPRTYGVTVSKSF